LVTETSDLDCHPVVTKTADRRKSILVVDEDVKRGELRASRLRQAGVEVQYAASIEAASFFLQEGSYDLVLVEMRKDPDRARDFCSSVRRRCPEQRMAFYVDGPQCISWSEPDLKANTDRAEGVARLNAPLGTPAAPRLASITDASRRIRLNRQLAVLRSRQADPNK
jgi:CheY-like chemotaxis protein